ncbi:MAG: WD40 repeat domain-containing protein, partial [Bifidobacteriaceae bacterium]|nr:WD40 repeat domain-containing protein [Bifidobacteriaceae bacterium]
MVTANMNGRVEVWDAAGLVTRVLSPGRAWVAGGAFGGDGASIVTVTGGVPQVWDADGKLRGRLSGGAGKITGFTMSRDGSTFVTGSGGETATVWNADCSVRHRLGGHGSRVVGAVIGESTVVTRSKDGLTRVWSDRGHLLETLTGAEDGGALTPGLPVGGFNA